MPAGHGMRSRTRDLFSRPETTSETTSTSRCLLGVGTKKELWGTHLRPKLRPACQVKALANVKIVQVTQCSYWRGHCLAVDDQGMTIKAELMFECVVFWFYPCGNEYGQCGEEPERKDDTGMPLKRDIIIPQRCASKLSVRQPLNALCLSGSCWRYALSGAYSRRTCLDLGSTMATWRHVYGWGRGEHWRLGFRDDKSSKMVPQRVQLLVEEDIIQVSCGGTHSVARTRDGRMFLFGRGDHGRLGYGRKVSTGHPSEVPINLPAPKNLSGGEDVGAQSLLLVVAITR
ncbi:hypothetical protein RHMOL_Rhmol12G0095200 [Rhododendron molle]|uniref:Uncharacterized protein n=1 Tax=Rhododendron molle TaxID=49168 RepID=A0ACC0LGH1_RHOML|nr:hypothetical protein RHMOL_Rhmol12G0095200 [Rhododendron molle]